MRDLLCRTCDESTLCCGQSGSARLEWSFSVGDVGRGCSRQNCKLPVGSRSPWLCSSPLRNKGCVTQDCRSEENIAQPTRRLRMRVISKQGKRACKRLWIRIETARVALPRKPWREPGESVTCCGKRTEDYTLHGQDSSWADRAGACQNHRSSTTAPESLHDYPESRVCYP